MSGRWPSTVLRTAAVLALTASLLGCEKTRRYESAVQIVHKETVEEGPRGEPLLIDFELEWDACPGDQFQVIRGGQAFAECTAKYEVGDTVPVYVKHWWDNRGFYRWDVERMGDCWRSIEPDSPGSYEKGQECKDIDNYGKRTGFACSRRPFRQLVRRCPWMARQ